MRLFKKKVKLFDINSEDELKRREKLLRDAGIWTNTWQTDPFPVLGGAHMKTADWADKTPENKDSQRIVYHLEVLEEDKYKAIKLLMEDGGVELTQG